MGGIVSDTGDTNLPGLTRKKCYSSVKAPDRSLASLRASQPVCKFWVLGLWLSIVLPRRVGDVSLVDLNLRMYSLGLCFLAFGDAESSNMWEFSVRFVALRALGYIDKELGSWRGVLR